MERQVKENILVEHVITLLNLLQANGIELVEFMEAEGRPERFSLPDSDEIRMAYQTIQFMEYMPGGFLIYHADGREEILYANRALLRIFHCGTMREFQDLTGRSFRGLVHPDDVEMADRRINPQAAASQQDFDHLEYRIIRKDGEVRWVDDFGHFVRSASIGDCFYVFLSDATERKRRHREEAELHERKLQALMQEYDRERKQIRQEQFRRLAVIEALSVNYESILYANLDKDTIRPYRLSSRTQIQFDENLQVRPFSEYTADYIKTWVHPEDHELVAQSMDPACIQEKLSENNTYYFNYRVIENGEVEYLQLRFVHVNEREPVYHVVIGCRRVDKELRQEMEQKQLLADALNSANLAITAKNTFLSNMSHDMRTPLNAVFGFTSLAKINLHNSGLVAKYLDQVETSGRQLLDLINKVLEIAWSESREAGAAEDECDLKDIAEEIHDFLLPHAAEKDIDFSLDCSGLKHSGVFGDQGKIKQLVMYLVNNAVTYTKPGGKVKMTVTEQNMLPNHCAVYQIVVADTGIGISEKFLQRIFEPFTRERNTTISGVHGTGLGLAIAKNIVDMLGGTIAAKSKEGEGSIFTVTLRLRVQPQQAPAAEEAAESAAPLSGKRILLVEDNEINREIETEILENLGFSIDTAVDGDVAVKKVAASAPGDYDLILMDLQMPVMDGWHAARAIRALEDPDQARIPIIALSANVFESDVRMSMESGMDAHIMKPLDVSVLLQTMKDVMQQRTPPQ